MPLRSVLNNPATVVSEIFREAGTAFHTLSDMTMLLHPVGDSQSGGKWTDEEIEMLRGCVHQFAVDLNKLSQRIKSRTASQIRTTLKKKAFEDAGIPVRQVSSTITSHSHQPQQVPLMTQSVLGTNAETATSSVANVARSADRFDSSDDDDSLLDDSSTDTKVPNKVAIYDYALKNERNPNAPKRARVNETSVRNEVVPRGVVPTAENVDDYFVRTLNRRKTKFANKSIRYNRRKKRLILKMKSRNRLVTLNMLNASESEVDVEDLADVKLEFEGSTDDIST